MSLQRREWESVPSHVERVLLDDLFEGASASEVAAFCGCKPSLVVQVRRNFFKVRGMRLAFEHAEYIRDRIDWPLGAASLIHMALERYAERVTSVTRSAGGCAAEGASGVQGPDGASRKAGAASRGESQTAHRPEALRQTSDGLPPLS